MTRLRWAQVGAGGLYLGGLLIGMAQAGSQGFAAILAMLLLWTILMRPAAQWSGPGAEGVIRLSATVATLAVLAGLLYGAGRLLAMIGWAPSVWAGLGLALGGVALARAVWNPKKAGELDALLDQAIAGITAASRPPDAPVEGYPSLDPDLTPIAALPEDTPDDDAQALVAAAFERHLPHWHDTSLRLIHLLGNARGARAGRRGVILWGTDPEIAAGRRFGAPMEVAFEVCWTDPGMLALFAPRALAVVRARPEGWNLYPTPSQIEQAIDPANDPATNEALKALAQAIHAAIPPEYRDEDAP